MCFWHPVQQNDVKSQRKDFTCRRHMCGQEQYSGCPAHFHYIPWNYISVDAVPSCCLAYKWCVTVFSLSVLIACTVNFYLTGSGPSPRFSVLVNDNHCLHQRVVLSHLKKAHHFLYIFRPSRYKSSFTGVAGCMQPVCWICCFLFLTTLDCKQIWIKKCPCRKSCTKYLCSWGKNITRQHFQNRS